MKSKAILEIMNKGYKAYTPLIYNGIDCIINTKEGYKTIIIKNAQKHSRDGLRGLVSYYDADVDYYIWVNDNNYWIMPLVATMERNYVSLKKTSHYYNNWGVLPKSK